MSTEMKVDVTEEHLRAAFEAFAWRGWTFDQAMKDELRAKLLRGRASSIAAGQHNARHAHSRVLVRRFNPLTGRWVTTTHAGPRTVPSMLDEKE